MEGAEVREYRRGGKGWRNGTRREERMEGRKNKISMGMRRKMDNRPRMERG